ncbi:MAG TPA: hypothetical protein DDW52_22015 [Planctomycetaceae bacterium]|nr:hypothetical protein [Planctomycetaceae bacterium]
MPGSAESGLVVVDPEPAELEPAEPEPLEPELAEPEPVRPAPVLPRLEFVSTQVDVTELVAEFDGDPELVIDSGGFISEIADVAISPDGKLLAAAGAKEVRIWEIHSGSLIHCLRGDRARTSYGDCNALAFSPDNEFLVVGVSDYAAHGNIRVYRTDGFDEINALLPGHTAPISKLCYSRNGSWMASADSDGNVAIWDWATRQMIKKIGPRDPQQPIVDELHFPGDEPVLAGVDFQGPFLLSVPELKRLSGQDQLPPRTLAWIYDVLTRQLEYPFSSTDDPRNLDLKLDAGKWTAAGIAEQDGRNRFWVGVWDARTMEQPVQSQPRTLYTRHRWSVTAIAIAPDHNLVASGDKFGEIHLWDASTGQQQAVFRGQGNPFYEAAYDGGPARIAFGTRPHPPSKWQRNDYGEATRVIDLTVRAIYDRTASAAGRDGGSDSQADLPTEIVSRGASRLRVMGTPGQANLRLEKLDGGETAKAYQFTTGRNPTAFSFVEHPLPGNGDPVLVGDNIGLFAIWDSTREELSRAYIGHDSLVSSICPSPSGNLVLSSSTDRTMRIWPLEEATPTGRFDFQFENSVVTKVPPESSSAMAGVQVGDKILDIDGLSITDMHRKMLSGEFDYRPGQSVPVTMSRDGASYSFNMTLTEGYDFSDPVLNIFIGDDDRWIIWTPAGYYDASPGAEQLIGWHVNRGPDKAAAFYKVQQFRDQLYRPDIINAILAGTPPEKAAREANAARGETDVDFRSPSDLALNHPPEVEFTAPELGDEVASPAVRLVATVRSRNGLPISEATVLVNGVSQAVLKPTDPAAQEMQIDMPVALASGRNDLEIIASNERATSFAQSVYVYAAPQPEAQGTASKSANLNVLAVGISEYQATPQFANLPLAASDAQAFVATAKTQAGGKLYNEVRSHVLTDDQATRTGILDGLQWLIDQTEVGDTVAIYISAHGFVDSTDNFYLGTHEVAVDRPRSTAVSWREFTKTIHADLPSCQRLLFLDLHPTRAAVSPQIRNPLLDLAAPEMATIFFSSNSLQQADLPDPVGNVGFSAAGIAQVLANPNADVQPDQPDSLLNAEEVSQAWLDAVREMARQQFYPVAFAPAKSKQQKVFELPPTQ